VASFRFSVRARDDLREIGAYTVRTWNEAQADRYLAQLEDHARALVSVPISSDARRFPARDGAMGAAKGPASRLLRRYRRFR